MREPNLTLDPRLIAAGGYCWCGCGQKTGLAAQGDLRMGYVKGQPTRYVLGHSSRKPQHFEETPDTHCWEWCGATSSTGYGRMGHEYVHRQFYEELIGPIPEGLYIDHLCRNRRCCNPGHLEVVTPAVNQQRGSKAKLTPEDVQEIRRLLAEGRLSQGEIGDRFGIDSSNVSRINTGDQWRNV